MRSRVRWPKIQIRSRRARNIYTYASRERAIIIKQLNNRTPRADKSERPPVRARNCDLHFIRLKIAGISELCEHFRLTRPSMVEASMFTFLASITTNEAREPRKRIEKAFQVEFDSTKPCIGCRGETIQFLLSSQTIFGLSLAKAKQIEYR